MPSFNPSVYSNYPIQIPPEFPKILKSYTKAAIRTQPYDLLLWSASYFRCLANGEIPPVKERIEYPVQQDSGEAALTPGLLRVLHKQIGKEGSSVSRSILVRKWRGICLSQVTLDNILETGHQGESEIQWEDFLIDAAMSMCVTVVDVMGTLCDILTDHPEGISNYALPDSEFLSYFSRVAPKFRLKEENVQRTLEYLRNVGRNQGHVLSVSNLKTPDCPLIY